MGAKSPGRREDVDGGPRVNLCAPDGSRLTIAVPPRRLSFGHRTIVGWHPARAPREADEVTSSIISTCITAYPDERCRCGIFDVEWIGRGRA